MARYRLVVTDQDTGNVVRDLESDVIVFSYLEIDDDGDPGASHSTLCASCGPHLIGVYAASVRYARVQARETFESYMEGEANS